MNKKHVFASLTKLSLFFVFATTVLCGTSLAQQWARDMFETTDHNFGTVARGAKADFQFVFTNIYQEDVHVSSATSSCGCTKVTVSTPGDIKTYEHGVILATINTAAFQGSKGATITVTFDKPQYAQVQLHVKANIRGDVVFRPGSVSFGTVEAGQPQEQSVNVDYIGSNGWRLEAVKSDNPHITADFVETGRNGSHVTYQLNVRLDPNSPVGYINDHLMLVTNEHASRQVPLQIEGRVDAGITVSPPLLFMGVIEPGQKVEKQLVVRGRRPFRILSINCPGVDFQFDKNVLNESKFVHIVPVTFTAGKEHGKVAGTIQIETDLQTAPQTLTAYAEVE